ncbi:TPA: hypothetical protein SIA26_001461 [Aeromonas bestiarum]|nr:hypothetical protein [Aeromonas bestiarum]
MSCALSALIPRLRTLLATGLMVANERDNDLPLHGLVHPLVARVAGDGEEGKLIGWVISQRLLAARPALASDAELLCALLAQYTELRAAWLTIAAARCKEAGQMAEGAILIELVSGLGKSAAWVEAALSNAVLDASPYAVQERELLGMSFEQAAATPALIRILAVAAELAEHQDALPALLAVDVCGIQAEQNWVKGRLLALPTSGLKIDTRALLSGDGPPQLAAGNTMAWVLAHPWVLLLTMLSYAQDAWRAENRGGLLLELPAGQNAFVPAEIGVTVIGVEGDEVRCGSLADLLLKILASLGVTCFPSQPSPAELNTQLSPLVGLLLKHSVWRYQDGASSQLGQYQIHPQFSDQCYSLPASRVFNRTGKLLWQAARLSAEALYQEHKQVYQHRSVREPEAEYAVQGEVTDE